jgi:hypothetical protein
MGGRSFVMCQEVLKNKQKVTHVLKEQKNTFKKGERFSLDREIM